MTKYRTLVLLVMTCTIMARADTLVYTVSQGRSEFIYDFTVTNTGSTSSMLFDLFLIDPVDVGSVDVIVEEGSVLGWSGRTVDCLAADASAWALRIADSKGGIITLA